MVRAVVNTWPCWWIISNHLRYPVPHPQRPSHLFPVEDSTFGMSAKPWKVMQPHHRDQRMPGCIKSKIPVTVKNKANQPLSRVSFGGIFSSNIAGFLLKWVFIAKSLAKKKRNHYSQKLPFVQPSLEAPTTFIYNPSWILQLRHTTFHETPETGEESGEWFPERIGVHKSSCDIPMWSMPFFFIAQDFQTPPGIKTGFETLLSFCGVP